MEYLEIARWLTVLGLLWLGGLPVAGRLFQRFPDRGASLALPVAMVVLALPVYWVGRVAFGPAALAVGGVVLLAVAALAWDGSGVDRRGLAEATAVFLAAFALMVAVRAANPSIVAAGGEKFLDYGLLNALVRADALPPEDVWFAGREVRYYYGGYLSTALVTMASGVDPPVAYNLGVATFYATLATTAYGLGSAVAEARAVPRRVAGALSAGLVALAGNLATPGRLLLGALPEPVARRYGHALLDGIRTGYGTALRTATDTSPYDYWFARYVVPDVPSVFPLWTFLNGDLRPHMTGATFLLVVAAVGYAYARTPEDAVGRRRLLAVGAGGSVAGLLTLVTTWGLPTAVGVVGLAVFFGDADPGSLLPGDFTRRIRRSVAGAGLPDAVGRELARGAAAAAVAVGAGAVAAAWVAPYLLFHTAENDGVGLFPPRSPVEGLVLVFGAFFVPFALHLAPELRAAVSGVENPRASLAAGAVALGAVPVLGAVQFGSVALVVGFLAVAWFLLRRRDPGYATVLFVAGLGLVLVAELAYARVWPHDPNAPRWNTVYKLWMQTWVLWGVGGGVAATEVLTRGAGPIRRLVGVAAEGPPGSHDGEPTEEGDGTPTQGVESDQTQGVDAHRTEADDGDRTGADDGDRTGADDADGREPGAGGTGEDGSDSGTPGLDPRGSPREDRTWRDWSRVAAVAVTVALLVGAGTFPVVALDQRFEAFDAKGFDDRTLDGTAHVERYHADEARAIDWLRSREGRPTLVTHPGDPYTWSAYPSVLTGLPTVAGWEHVAGYHGEAAYERRLGDVRAVYAGNLSAAAASLDAYDVDYVYVGPVECDAYGAVSFDGLDGVSVAHRSGNVTVYAVDQDRLGVDEDVPGSVRPLSGDAC